MRNKFKLIILLNNISISNIFLFLYLCKLSFYATILLMYEIKLPQTIHYRGVNSVFPKVF